MWRILRILEGIFHQGERWLLDLQNSSYPTQPHSIIAKSLEYMHIASLGQGSDLFVQSLE